MIVALDGRVSTLESQMSTLLGTTVPALEGADTSLDGRLDAAESTITSHTSTLSGLATEQTTQNGRLTSLEDAHPVRMGKLIQLSRQGKI